MTRHCLGLTSNVCLFSSFVLFMIETHSPTVLIRERSPRSGATRGGLARGRDRGDGGYRRRRNGNRRQASLGEVRLVVGEHTGPRIRGQSQGKRSIRGRYRHAVGRVQGYHTVWESMVIVERW